MGSISNSQSLNRYSYVQGNPVSYTDPFGLSPLSGLFTGTTFVHCLFGVLGCVPGPVGVAANLADALVYALVDHDYLMAGISVLGAVTLGAGSIAAKAAKGTKLALGARCIQYASGLTSNILMFGKNVNEAQNIINKKSDLAKTTPEGQAYSKEEKIALGTALFGCLLASCGIASNGVNLGKAIKEAQITNQLQKQALTAVSGNKSSRGTLGEETFTRYMPDGRQVIDVKNLPGSDGIKISRRLTTDEMTFLTQEYGVEFAQVYKYGNGVNGGGGQYYLYSGTVNAVQVPVAQDIMLINHTHPSGTARPSSIDMTLLGRYQQLGSPQLSSEIIPIGKNNVKFNINGLIGD